MRLPRRARALRPRRGRRAHYRLVPTAACGSTTSRSTTSPGRSCACRSTGVLLPSTRPSACRPSTRARWARPSRCSSSRPGSRSRRPTRCCELEPDVEALLVNRARGAREYWLVPIDECYALVGPDPHALAGPDRRREVWEDRRLLRRTRQAARGIGRDRQGGRRWQSQVGKPDVHPTRPRTRRVSSRATRRQLREQTGHLPDGRRRPQRSTGINAKGAEPIDPRMPNLSPA